ncbi:hypothetical protein [Flavobacterium sp.]|uniref:hypothetical protein n=1 Tax=Flavobacterium sp. TaxID=239 RepID=UPI0040336173
MKKIFLLLSVLSLGLASCDSNDDSTGFDSNITVDGIIFTPAANGGTAPVVSTAFAQGSGENDDTRFFKLTRNGTNDSGFQQIQIYINLPQGQSNSSGSYTFDQTDTASGLTRGGAYAEGNVGFDFTSGKIIVTQMTANNYMLQFVDVKAKNAVSGQEKIISGQIKGKFDIEQVYILD